MPLPSNTSLSLLGYSRPGDTLQSNPKQAMLVRLSSETLDALESFSSHPQVQFEFGENPGLYIGEEYFPMRHSSENSNHELFLRASPASKKSAPLKLHANVVGKFTVERELADHLREKIRGSTQDCANQRNSRSTVLLDTPLDLPSNARKRKDAPSTMFRRSIRPSDKLKAPAISSGQYATNQSASTSQSKDNSSTARKRVIQYLALNGESTEERLLQIATASDRNVLSSRQLSELLEQVAEATAMKGKPTESAKIYRLKPVTWKEVRPFEWTGLTEQEQTKIARQARTVFQHSLKIPENDPMWDHVRYRNTNLTGFSSTEGNVVSDPLRDGLKRGISSRDAKEKRPKQKGEIMMKDESFVTTATHKASNHTEKILNASDLRRISDPKDSVSSRSHTSLTLKPTRTLSSQIDKDLGKPSSSKNKVVQTGQTEKNMPTGASRTPTTAQGDKMSASSKSQKAWRDEEHSTLNPERVKRTQQPESSKMDVIGNVVRDYDKNSSAKRKLGDQPDGNLYDSPSTPTKRLKFDNSESLSSKKEDHTLFKTETRQIDKHPSKKVLPSSALRSRKGHDSSPPPPPPIKRQSISNSREGEKVLPGLLPASKAHSTVANSSQVSKAAGSTKIRRSLPEYTSSSEEDETPANGPRTTLGVASSLDKKISSQTRNHPLKALPTDHTALRALYSRSYLEYLSAFQRLVIEKGKINSRLNNDMGNAGASTDSEGDADLMDPDELAKLTMTYKEREEELERIQRIFRRASGELATDLLS